MKKIVSYIVLRAGTKEEYTGHLQVDDSLSNEQIAREIGNYCIVEYNIKDDNLQVSFDDL